MSELQQQVQELLNKAFKIQEDYEYGMFRQASTAALDSAISAIADMDKRYNAERRRTRSLDEGSSDQDSFVSAIDVSSLCCTNICQIGAVNGDQMAVFDRNVSGRALTECWNIPTSL